MGDATTAPDRRRIRLAPALLPAAVSILGVRLGIGLSGTAAEPPWGLVIALLLLGLALGRRPGSVVACGSVGILVGLGAGAPIPGASSAPSRTAWPPDPDRPVAGLVRVVGHWRRLDDSWSAPVRMERLSQWCPKGRAPQRSGVQDPTERPTQRRTLRVRTRVLEATLRMPGDDPPPPLGSRLRVRGHLRRAPPLGNVPRLPPGPWRLSVKSRRLARVVDAPGPVARLASRLRRIVEAGIERQAHRSDAESPGAPWEAESVALPLARSITRALVLGDASRVPPSVRRGLRRLGLAHVLAVSGLHVGLVAGVALLLGAGLSRRLRVALAIVAVGAYLLVVGPRPSLVRASVMACLAAVALLMDRPPNAVNGLAVAAGGIALADPEVVLDLGFRLTVGATAGIVVLGPELERRWSRSGEDRAKADRGRGVTRSLTRTLARSCAASVGAQVGVLPWALPAFCLLTPWAPIANLVAVPWTALGLVGCLGWAALSCAVPPLAEPALPALELLVRPFAWPAALPPRPWIALPVSVGLPGATLIAAGVGFFVWSPRRRWPLAAVAFGVALAAAGPGALDREPTGARGRTEPTGDLGVEAFMFDVGQGDALLLRDGGKAVLVDGGGWRHGDLGGRVLLPALVELGLRRLDAVVVTHPDRDHCGGLVDLAGYLAVGEAISGPGIERTSCGRSLDGLPGVGRKVVAAGDRLRVGRWRLRVLHPPVPPFRNDRETSPDLAGRTARGRNDASLVIVARAFGRRLLLTGDVQAFGEYRLLRLEPRALRADVLKVAHHGSRSSTARRFVEAVAPRIALVSAGTRNPYGHPAPEVLDRLRRGGTHVFRTDRHGMVALRIRRDGSLFVRLPGQPKG